MSDWSFFIILLTYVVIYILIRLNEKQHRQEMWEMYQRFEQERKELLDRIMANNIHEFKAATNTAPVKRSSTGNFLKDQMEKTARMNYPTE